MLIRVKYLDDRYDMVCPERLNSLLDAGKVQEFKRSDGWVMPKVDRMRLMMRDGYAGRERRRNPPVTGS